MSDQREKLRWTSAHTVQFGDPRDEPDAEVTGKWWAWDDEVEIPISKATGRRGALAFVQWTRMHPLHGHITCQGRWVAGEANVIQLMSALRLETEVLLNEVCGRNHE